MNSIVGAAVFDLNGLPQEYFATTENRNMSWVQTIFQALGLRSLLVASLHLNGFRNATIEGTDYDAIVVKQKTCYIAVLIKHQDEVVPDDIIACVEQFQLSTLRDNPRFRVA